MTDQIARNRRRRVLLLTGFGAVIAVVLGAILFALGLGVLAPILAVVVAGGTTAHAYSRSDSVVLSRSGAQPAHPVTHARLHNVVEGLCVAGGLSKPGLYVIDDDAPNALVAGRTPDNAAIAVTSGLLSQMDRVELEAVMAHELGHVKSEDTGAATVAVTTVGLVAPQLITAAVGPRSSWLADASAVEMTRYPPALISALEKLEQHVGEVASHRSIAHLWLVPPSGSAAADRTEGVQDRIAALREL